MYTIQITVKENDFTPFLEAVQNLSLDSIRQVAHKIETELNKADAVEVSALFLKIFKLDQDQITAFETLPMGDGGQGEERG